MDLVVVYMGKAPSHTPNENSIGLARGGMPNDGGYGYIFQTALTFLRGKISPCVFSNYIHN